MFIESSYHEQQNFENCFLHKFKVPAFHHILAKSMVEIINIYQRSYYKIFIESSYHEWQNIETLDSFSHPPRTTKFSNVDSVYVSRTPHGYPAQCYAETPCSLRRNN